MRPSGEKQSRSDALQAVVQNGTVGFYPFNSLGVTALVCEQARCIIGETDPESASRLQRMTDIKLGAETFSLVGKVFNGFSDAFYRGKLPEVVVVSADMMALPRFLESFMSFVEKLYSLGFLSTQPTEETELLDRYLPQFVIASYGLVYDVLLENLGRALENLSEMPSRQKERLLQKFSRGIFVSPAPGYDLQLIPPIRYEKPLTLKLAGSKSMFTIRTTQVLESNRLLAEFNPNGAMGILEWELNLAASHLKTRLIPALNAAAKGREADASVLTPEIVGREIDLLGQKHGLLPGMAVASSLKPETIGKSPAPKLSTEDLAILHQLRLMAAEASLDSFVQQLETAIAQVQTVLSSTETVSTHPSGGTR